MISALKLPARSAIRLSFAVATAAELPLPADESVEAAIAALDDEPALDMFGVEFAAEDWVADDALAKAPLACSAAVMFAAMALRPERPESVSRFRRWRSARMSAACW